MTSSDSTNQRSYHHRVIPALLVIALGVFFLLDNLGIELPFFDFENWWAWIILFAAAWPLTDAARRYRSVGKVDNEVVHSLLSATAIVMVALMFILELPWHQWWPVFVIYGGLCMLVRGPRKRADRDLD